MPFFLPKKLSLSLLDNSDIIILSSFSFLHSIRFYQVKPSSNFDWLISQGVVSFLFFSSSGIYTSPMVELSEVHQYSQLSGQNLSSFSTGGLFSFYFSSNQATPTLRYSAVDFVEEILCSDFCSGHSTLSGLSFRCNMVFFFG